MSATEDWLREFGDQGYVVVPNVVSPGLLDEAVGAIDGLIAREPPPRDRRGHYFYWLNDPAPSDPLLRLFTASPALAAAEAMTGLLRIRLPRQVQVSLNIPPCDHRPGGPHLDGLTPPEPSGRPGTFTLLAGIFLTDQSSENMGNLWVWPGTHHTFAAHLRMHGPDALRDMAHPTFGLPEPKQVCGRAGDLLLAHYLLGHNMGGNLSSMVRRVAYARLRTEGHEERWQDVVQDALLEFAPVRAARLTENNRDNLREQAAPPEA